MISHTMPESAQDDGCPVRSQDRSDQGPNRSGHLPDTQIAEMLIVGVSVC